MDQMNSKLSIGILGPGAIGGLLAALFWKMNYDVVCIGNDKTVESISSDGITLKSSVFGNFLAKPLAFTSLSSNVDVLFVTVKMPNLDLSIERIELDLVQPSLVVPLLNGRGHYETLRRAFGDRVVAGTIGSIEASKLQSVVHHHSISKPRIELASNDGFLNGRVYVLAQSLKAVGIKTQILSQEEAVIWNKLIRLDAISSMTTALQTDLGGVLVNEGSALLLKGLIDEAALVALKEGFFFDPLQTLSEIQNLPSSLKTSMQRDVASGQVSEASSITGSIIALAKKYGVPVPIHKKVFSLIDKQIHKASFFKAKKVRTLDP